MLNMITNLSRLCAVLAAAVLVTGSSEETTTPVDYIWRCEGKYSKLNYNDCMGDYYNTIGCYYKENFAQYRPCAAICNDVPLMSIDEERCQATCPDYLKSCRLTSADTLIHKSTEKIASLEQSNTVAPSPQISRANSVSVVLLVFCAGLALALLVFISILLSRPNVKAKLCNMRRHRELRQTVTYSYGVQEVDGVMLQESTTPAPLVTQKYLSDHIDEEQMKLKDPERLIV